MYKFAYFYVKLGYIIASSVFVISMCFCVFNIIVLQSQKPSASSSIFNEKLEKIQSDIQSQCDVVQKTFNISPDVSPLICLREMTWHLHSLSFSELKRLNDQRAESMSACEELKGLVLLQLNENIKIILDQLHSASSSLNNQQIHTTDDKNDKSNILVNGKNVTSHIYTNVYDYNINYNVKIKACELATKEIDELLQQTKKLENISLLNDVQKQILHFIQVINRESEKHDGYREFVASKNPSHSISQQAQQITHTHQKEYSSKKSEAFQNLKDVLNLVSYAVTNDWVLERLITQQLNGVLLEIDEKTAEITAKRSAISLNQISYIGILILFTIISFFIAVGSDLVKSILDSAIWLSHIYSNTASKEGSEPK